MHKLLLKSCVANRAMTGLALTGLSLGLALSGMALPALANGAHAGDRPMMKPYDARERAIAAQQIQVVPTGGSDLGVDSDYGRHDHGGDHVLAMTDDNAPTIACPDGPVGSPAWQQVPEDLRRHAIAGQCFSRLLKAPKIESYKDRVLVRAEKTETRVIPEVTEMVEDRVMVRPEGVKRVVVPAVAHTEVSTEIVRPASFREETIPARYETRKEQVMVSEPHQEWVRSKGVPLSAPLVTPDHYEHVRYRDDGTLNWPGKDGRVRVSDETGSYVQNAEGEWIWCLNAVDGVYEDRVTQVEVAPASVRRIEIPAETRQVSHMVIDVPEHVREEVVPAVYEKRRVKRVVQEARTETYTVPAVYDDVMRTRVVGEAEPVWREVICGKNTSPQKIAEVQRALAARGYNPGKIDGQLGQQTVAAMQKFQADNGLPQGQPSVEAVRLLGVPLVPLTQNQ
ncbi:MAG: peptidoglycan-binding domain-containing protein [Asticcacaulis sp.]